MMTVIITLTVAGTDTANFSLYSDLDSFATPFETGISRAALLAGYTSSLVPDYTNTIRVQSTGTCTNYVDITVTSSTTTTTTEPPPYYRYIGVPHTSEWVSSGEACNAEPCSSCALGSIIGSCDDYYSQYNTLHIGDVLYSDSALTTPINGNNYYFSLGLYDGVTVGITYAVQISTTGEIMNLPENCCTR